MASVWLMTTRLASSSRWPITRCMNDHSLHSTIRPTFLSRTGIRHLVSLSRPSKAPAGILKRPRRQLINRLRITRPWLRWWLPTLIRGEPLHPRSLERVLSIFHSRMQIRCLISRTQELRRNIPISTLGSLILPINRIVILVLRWWSTERDA